MPLFLIERNFPEQLEVTPEIAGAVIDANTEARAQWSHSYLTDDKMKTYCLYEAANPDIVREAAQCAGIPVDVIVEVSVLRPPA